jgi:hypothetical protein
MRQPLADLLDKHLDHRVIELLWRDEVECRVVGSPTVEMIDAAARADSQHRQTETLVGRALTTLLTLPQRGRKRRGPISFDEIVAPELRTGRGDVLRSRVYRFD